MHNKSKFRALITASYFVAFANLPVGTAGASDASPDQQPGEVTNAPALEEIIVTARKREENLQTSPAAVSLISGAALEQRGIENINDLGSAVPNVIITPSVVDPGSDIIVIRGSGGTTDLRPFNDTSTALYVDGVLLPRPSHSNVDLVDVENVEVLRGPQGTLFGRNSTGGAISITTRAPTSDLEFEQNVEYGSFHLLTSRSTLNTGNLGTSDWAARLVYSHSQRDGYQYVADRDGALDPGAYSTDAFYGTLRGSLLNDVTLNIAGNFVDKEVVPPADIMVNPAPFVVNYFSLSPSYGGAPFVRYSGSFQQYVQQYDDLPRSHDKNYGTSVTLNWKTADTVDLKSISAVGGGTNISHLNTNGGTGNPDLLGLVLNPATGAVSVQPVTPFGPVGPVTDESQVFSEEVQALGSVSDFEYVAGLYYFEENPHYSTGNIFNYIIPTAGVSIPITLLSAYNIRNYAYAAYGQVNYHPPVLDRRIELTVGLRDTTDSKSLREDSSTSGVPFDRYTKISWHYVSYNSSVKMQWTPNLMTYLRVASASRAGGINPGTTAVDNTFQPEMATVYELGERSEFYDHRLRLNLTVYQTNITDLQLNNFEVVGTGFVNQTVNAGKARNRGVELESIGLLTSAFQVYANASYIDPKFLKYDYTNPITGTTTDIAEYAHEPFVSERMLQVGVQYALTPRPFGNPILHADYAYRSAFYSQSNPFINYTSQGVMNDFHELNARATIAEIPLSPTIKGKVEVYAENILDEHPDTSIADLGSIGFSTAMLQIGRTFGVSFNAKF